MAWTIRQMGDFAVGRDGDGSALVVFHASIRCSVWGHSDPHADRIDVHIAPDVGATSFGSPPVANRAHRQSNLGRSARGRSRGAITRLDVGKHGVFGEHVRSLPNISGLTGATGGKGAPSPWSRPDRAASCCSSASAEAVPFAGIAGRSTSLLRKAKGIERDWL
jgi:hypothetical protein